MRARQLGLVMFGDVVDSRRDLAASTAFLRALREELAAPGVAPLEAPVGITQGDELQLLLAPGADPFPIVLRAALGPATRPMRWAIVHGTVEPGRGPATERTGEAFILARELLVRAKAGRDGLLARTGDAASDTLLDDLAPLLPALLDDLTPRQREIGRLVLVGRRRRSEAAEQLGISRATVSVAADRGRLREIERLARALATVFARGTMAATEPGGNHR